MLDQIAKPVLPVNSSSSEGFAVKTLLGQHTLSRQDTKVTSQRPEAAGDACRHVALLRGQLGLGLREAHIHGQHLQLRWASSLPFRSQCVQQSPAPQGRDSVPLGNAQCSVGEVGPQGPEGENWGTSQTKAQEECPALGSGKWSEPAVLPVT